MTSQVHAPLTANAVFSLATGLLIAATPSTVGDWLGVEVDGWLRLFGLALIGHALLLGWALSRPDPVPMARLNLLAITPYPALMVGLVATGLIDRSLGQVLALVDGAIIAGVACWLWMGLREPQTVGHAQAA